MAIIEVIGQAKAGGQGWRIEWTNKHLPEGCSTVKMGGKYNETILFINENHAHHHVGPLAKIYKQRCIVT